MLVLSRKIGETIMVGDGIEIKICAIMQNRVKIGLVAPAEVNIVRSELPVKRRPVADEYHDLNSFNPILFCPPEGRRVPR